MGKANQRKNSRTYMDSLPTTWRKAWRALVANAALEIIPKGASFGISIVATPVGGEIAGKVTKRVLRYTLQRFAHIYEEGEVKLTELFRGEIPDQRYQGVGDFWTRVLDHGLTNDALIEVTGLLSPYGPLMPAHPMSRPGYTVEGWEALGELETEDTEEYDTRDGFIYGDRVIRLSHPRLNKYFAGLYDAYFGISNVSIPLYIDQGVFHSNKPEVKALKEMWQYPMTGGKIVKIKGRLREISNFYTQFAPQLPEQYCSLPSFGLEVFRVEEVIKTNGVTHMAVSVSWEKREEERMLTHYFNVQNKRQFEIAEELLERGRENHTKSLLLNYDDLACFSPEWRHRLPQYNEMLVPWLEGEKL